MFELIRPDTIAQSDGVYRFTYAGDRDIKSLPIGAEFTVIYSPSGNINNWHATRYRVVTSSSPRLSSYIQQVKQRELEPKEIAHFEGLIADRGG